MLKQIAKILYSCSSNQETTNIYLLSTNGSFIKNKNEFVLTPNPIIKLYEKLNGNIGKFYQKV